MTGRNSSAFISFITPAESARRTGGIRKTRLTTANTATSASGAPKPTSATRPASAHSQSGAPVKPSANKTSSTPTAAAQAGVNAFSAPWMESSMVYSVNWDGLKEPHVPYRRDFARR